MTNEDRSEDRKTLEQWEDFGSSQTSILPAHGSEKSQDVHLSRAENWWNFWFSVWLGATFAGGVFGSGLGFLAFISSGSFDGLTLPFIGLAVGGIWAGLVGVLVIPTFAFIVWCFWLQKRPGILAACAGALTGFICAPIAFFFTSPLGAAGAYLAVTRLCRLPRDENCCSSQRPVFSIQDLFWRMTGFAIILTMWLTVIRWMWPT